MQETAASPSLPEDYGNINVEEEETPQVNLKDVFQSDKKKDSHKSRSKLRSRIQVKKSQLEAQAQEEYNVSCSVNE